MRSRLLRADRVWLILLVLAFFENSLLAPGRVSHYLIKLREEPVVAYFVRRHPASKQRANLTSPDASSYRSHILVQQAAVKRRIEAFPEAQVRTQMDTVFNGMAVTLREEDVESVERIPEVDEVIAPLRYRKALDAALPLTDVPQAWTNPKIGGESNAGAGIRIAIIDTGIDISHPMFQDPSLTPPSGYPRFTAPTSDCPNSDQRYTNSKVIVARNYVSLLDSPDPNCDAEDRDGHGTFIAGIAAGQRVTAPLASLVGAAPKAFLGSYKVFGTPGTNDEATLDAILKAMDDAVKDGMQVINLSLGAPSDRPPARDPLAVTVATAVDSGVTVVVASGNNGPGTGTVGSPGISPAAITVGATTNGRFFAHPLTLTASAPVPPELTSIGALPGNGPPFTFTVGPAPLADVQALDASGTACSALPLGPLQDRMAFIRRGECNFSVKIRNAFRAGAMAAILYNNQPNQPPVLMDVETATQIPAVMIGNSEGVALKQFLAATTSGVQASLGATRKAIPTTPNRITDFSSDGPSTDFGIKPDLVAPGTTIYSAAQRNFPSGEQYDPSGFDFASGTSFSAPLVAGAAALVKQVSPHFTPAQIKSALVNTAAKVVADSLGATPRVLTQGNGLLDVAAAVSTPATVNPVSISFGARTPGTLLSNTSNLLITNVGSASDSFRVTVTPRLGDGRVTWTASPSNLALAAGATETIAVTATSSGPLNETIEGYLSIRSDNTQRTITVPYWGTFLLPTVNPGGILNAASYSFGPSTLAAGSLVSIFGSQLANETGRAVTLPLPKSLGGVRVTMDGTAVPFLFASPSQINAQIPLELSGKASTTVVVHLNGVASSPVSIPLSAAAPGIFTAAQNGRGRGAIVHASDFSAVTAEKPARTGEVLAVFATGLGATSPATATGAPASSSSLAVTRIIPSATMGGIATPVQFSGLAPSFVGLYQVNIEVPSGVPPGEQTLVLTSSGVASNPVTVALAP